MTWEYVQAYSRCGAFLGFAGVKPEDICQVCEKPALGHIWIQADNGVHLNCSNVSDKPSEICEVK